MKITVNGYELIERIENLMDIIDALPFASVTIVAYGENEGPKAGRVVVRGGYAAGGQAELRVRGHVVEPGSATVRFRELLNACVPYRRDMVTFSADATFNIVCQSRVALELLPGMESPPLPDPPADATCATFAQADLVPAVLAAEHAQGEDEYRRVLRGVKIEVGTDMKLRAIATDGCRLCVAARRAAHVPNVKQEGGANA